LINQPKKLIEIIKNIYQKYFNYIYVNLVLEIIFIFYFLNRQITILVKLILLILIDNDRFLKEIIKDYKKIFQWILKKIKFKKLKQLKF